MSKLTMGYIKSPFDRYSIEMKIREYSDDGINITVKGDFAETCTCVDHISQVNIVCRPTPTKSGEVSHALTWTIEKVNTKSGEIDLSFDLVVPKSSDSAMLASRLNVIDASAVIEFEEPSAGEATLNCGKKLSLGIKISKVIIFKKY